MNQAAFDAYIDQCEAENWEGRTVLDGETIFPFQRPPVEMVARLYELSGNDVEVMISAIQQYRGEGSFPDPERRVHSAGFHDVIYECAGNLFGRVPPGDDRFVAELVEDGAKRGWNDAVQPSGGRLRRLLDRFR